MTRRVVAKKIQQKLEKKWLIWVWEEQKEFWSLIFKKLNVSLSPVFIHEVNGWLIE